MFAEERSSLVSLSPLICMQEIQIVRVKSKLVCRSQKLVWKKLREVKGSPKWYLSFNMVCHSRGREGKDVTLWTSKSRGSRKTVSGSNEGGSHWCRNSIGGIICERQGLGAGGLKHIRPNSRGGRVTSFSLSNLKIHHPLPGAAHFWQDPY